MGMEAVLAQITPAELKAFLKHPSRAYEEILPELTTVLLPSGLVQMEGFAERLEETLRNQQQQMETALKNMPAPLAAQLKAGFEKAARQMRKQMKTGDSETSRKLFSLHKDWHVLHYVLTGTGEAGDKPVERCILGGTELAIPPDHPVDYGPLRYLTANEVNEIANALGMVDPQSLLGKLNREDGESKQVYLARNMDDPKDWSYLPELFADFRRFYQDAAKSENAMMLKIV